MIKILIIEDEPLIARDLKRITTNNGYNVVGVCYNSDKALDSLARRDYDLILLDIHLKGTRSGIELAELINLKYQKPFIFITSFADKLTIDKVKQTHPAGYVLKPFIPEEIFSAIEIAIYRFLSAMHSDLSRNKINERFNIKLTPKEFCILEDLIEGLNNSQIASKQHISLNTVKGHIKSIYVKLETHTRAETVGKVLS